MVVWQTRNSQNSVFHFPFFFRFRLAWEKGVDFFVGDPITRGQKCSGVNKCFMAVSRRKGKKPKQTFCLVVRGDRERLFFLFLHLTSELLCCFLNNQKWWWWWGKRWRSPVGCVHNDMLSVRRILPRNVRKLDSLRWVCFPLTHMSHFFPRLGKFFICLPQKYFTRRP